MDNEAGILLIDDDDADVELTLYALRKNKLVNHIQVLRDGEEAVDYLFGPGRDLRSDWGGPLGRDNQLRHWLPFDDNPFPSMRQ